MEDVEMIRACGECFKEISILLEERVGWRESVCPCGKTYLIETAWGKTEQGLGG